MRFLTNNMASFIESIYNSSSDQIQSQYNLKFGASAGGTIPGYSIPAPYDESLLILRLDKEFEIPQRSTYQYEYYYNGLKIQKTGPKDDTDKIFRLDFRLDQNWIVYDAMRSWYTSCFNDQEGIVGSENLVRRDITFTALGPPKNILASHATAADRTDVAIFKFRYCKIKSLEVPEFNHESGDPARVTCEFMYLFYESNFNKWD